MNALEVYERNRASWSDVYQHLPRLFDAAKGVVVELGVRHGVSTSALLAGVEAHGGGMWSVDIDPNCSHVFEHHPLWKFVCADSANVMAIRGAGLLVPVDVLFIDTLHTYERTMTELAVWQPYMRKGGRIFLHDTDDGSTYPGVRKALYEFCSGLNLLYWLYPGSYGLGEIEC